MATSGTRVSDGVAEVVLGVDTHLDFHVAVALDHLGRRLGEVVRYRRRRRATVISPLGRKDSAP